MTTKYDAIVIGAGLGGLSAAAMLARNGVYRYLEYLGMADRVEFLHVSNLYRSVFPDLDVTLPVGREAFEAKLVEAFPHEAKGIHRFLDRVFNFGRDFSRITWRGGKVNPATVPFRYPHFFRYLPTTWGHVLNRDVRDPRARAVISQYWGYVGLPPSKISDSCRYWWHWVCSWNIEDV